MTKPELLKIITAFYQESTDFNGIPASNLLTAKNTEKRVRSTLVAMLQEGLITVESTGNPHIKPFSSRSTEAMIEAFGKTGLECSCIYPSQQKLRKMVDVTRYVDRPFTLRLAQGEGQLDYQAFDLRVLEFYRNDPRYLYACDDIRGHVGIRDAYFLSDLTRDAEKISLQTFGFGYNDKMDRAIVVFLRYLHDLSPMHQQIWNGHALSDRFTIHPDYFRNSILGEFGEGISIFHAFVEELETINKMTALMGHPKLFLRSYAQDRPREFSFLIRPTAKAFSDFIHLLDRMMSDNLNRDFFRGSVALESEQTRKDGKITVSLKGTISLLEDWLIVNWRPQDRMPEQAMIGTFRKIRKLRQKPAHLIEDDSFDQMFFRQQRELIKEAYDAIRLIRLIFQNHPRVKDFKVPEYLNGQIWTR